MNNKIIQDKIKNKIYCQFMIKNLFLEKRLSISYIGAVNNLIGHFSNSQFSDFYILKGVK